MGFILVVVTSALVVSFLLWVSILLVCESGQLSVLEHSLLPVSVDLTTEEYAFKEM